MELFQSPQWGSNSKAGQLAFKTTFGVFQSPQWGSNSKADVDCENSPYRRFSPRNGEVILKVAGQMNLVYKLVFQSPQWGSNSKDIKYRSKNYSGLFQSPQWGSNSKGVKATGAKSNGGVSVPAMGK